jgi:putative hydrolase of the HAD superfamily
VIRVVCFDIGGVLVRIHHDLGAVAHSLGIAIRPGTERTPLANPIVDAYQAARISYDEFLARLADHFAISREDAERIHHGVPIAPYEGTLERIQELEEAGIATGCLSNTNAEHWARLIDPSQFPNVARLQTKVASHLVGLNKPEPEIYRAFEAMAGESEILFFDDSEVNVRGARAVGWNAERIDPDQDPARQIREHLNAYGVARE